MLVVSLVLSLLYVHSDCCVMIEAKDQTLYFLFTPRCARLEANPETALQKTIFREDLFSAIVTSFDRFVFEL